MSNPVSAMFGRIAGVYDLLNHVLSFGIDRSWRKELAARALEGQPPAPVILDLAAGTLDVAIAISRACPAARIPAFDFCPPMLARGLRKLDKHGPRHAILPGAANALRLPLPDASVDAVTIAFGIRNIPDRVAAFSEMRRVLRPGGRACVLEFGSASERILGGVYNFYLAQILPRVGRALARDQAAYQYLADTIKNFPAAPELCAEMEKAGLRDAAFSRLTGGIVCLHWAKKASAETAQDEEQKHGEGKGHAAKATQAVVVQPGGLEHGLAGQARKERKEHALKAKSDDDGQKQ